MSQPLRNFPEPRRTGIANTRDASGTNGIGQAAAKDFIEAKERKQGVERAKPKA